MLSEIHAELERRLEQQSAAYDAILKRLNELYAKGLLDIEVAPEIHLEGASNLVGLDLHLTREKLRELFHTLEEKKRILQLLDRFLEQPAGEVGRPGGLGRRASQHAGAVADRSFDFTRRRPLRQDRRAGAHAHELRKGHVGGVSRRAGLRKPAGLNLRRFQTR